MRRSRSLPFLVATLVFGCFLFLNLDGYHLHVFSAWSSRLDVAMEAEPPEINWVHGWPLGCVVRSSIYSAQAGKGVPFTTTTGNNYGFYSRWPVDNAPIFGFDVWYAIANFLIGAAVVAGTYFGTIRLTDHFRWRVRFSVRMLLVATALASLGLCIREPLLANRYVVEYAAFGGVLAGVTLSLLVVFPLKWLDAGSLPSVPVHHTEHIR